MDLLEHQLASSPKINRHPWEQTRLRILQFLIKPYHRRKILDVGSGDAFIASEIAKTNPGATVTGFDINYTDEILETLSAIKPANLFLKKNLNEIKDFNNDSDIVVLMDVLEHIQEPAELLKFISTNFTNNNTIYVITVPAFQSLFSEHDRKLGHVKRYNLKKLKSLLRQCQLQAISEGYVFTSLFVIRKIQLLLEKKTGRHTYDDAGINNWKAGRFVSITIGLIFWMEFKISWYLSKIGIHIPGLTCFCICRRSPL